MCKTSVRDRRSKMGKAREGTERGRGNEEKGATEGTKKRLDSCMKRERCKRRKDEERTNETVDHFSK